MTVSLSPVGGAAAQFFNNDGNPLSGGKIYTYLAGTNTPQATYTTSAGNVAHSNPIILDSSGRVSAGGEIWLTNGQSYKFVIKDSSEVLIGTYDNVVGNGSIDAEQVSYTAPYSGAVASNVEAKLSEYVSPTDFGAVGNGIANDTAAISSAISNKKSGGINVVSQSAYDYGLLDAGFVNVNVADGATIGSTEILTNGTFTGSATGWTLVNFSYSANTIAHTAGSVGTASQSIVVKPFRTYLATVTLTTSTFGTVDILINGTSYLEGGYQYAVGSTSNQFALLLPDTGTVNFQISTDTAWAGSIDSLSLIEVANEWRPNAIWAATDDTQLRIPQGIKFGRYNAGNISIGDRQTMALTQNAGVWNVAIGARALSTNQTGFENTALGTFALQYGTSSRNTAVGYSALKYLSNGEQNTGLGFKSFAATAGGSRNTGVGFHSGLGNVSGSGNTMVGWQTGYQAKIADGNTFVGDQVGMSHTGGANTMIGAGAGILNANVNILYSYTGTTCLGAGTKVYGDNGIAIGYVARVGADGAPVSASIAVGRDAVAATDESVAVGFLSSATGGFRGVVVGARAISTSSDRGTAIGWSATAAGQYTTAIGGSAGIQMSGNENTFLGTSAGNISTNTYTNCTLLGYGTDVTGSNQVQLGDSRTTTYAYGAVQNRSDARDKADVQDTVLGLDFINSLRPVDFKWDYRDSYREIDANGNITELPKDGSRKRTRYHHGLIAQEVKAACDAVGVDFGGYQDHSIKGGADVLSIGYEELIAPLIKAVQELSQQVEMLKQQINQGQQP